MNSRSWRGKLVLSGMANSTSGGPQELRATVAETNGDSRLEAWPAQFLLHICKRTAVLQAMQIWVERNNPPLCAFMPDRHPDPQLHKLNQSNFRSFSRLLSENQLVAVTTWQLDPALPESGVILYPAPSTPSLLVGVIFPFGAFPDFITGRSPTVSQQTPSIGSYPSSQQYPGATPQFPVHPTGYQQLYPQYPVHMDVPLGEAQYAFIPAQTSTQQYPHSADSSSSDSSWPSTSDGSLPPGYQYPQN
ncbi:hypothetical protein PUNSTDRAFT_68833 [Punctularia strigosozonata HHB-11173 SS5]|uniref:uncharacterized protein n=1 Tax=Punctularia strigosozonata (strain HHB-11173) TaxID=741275 RepID=UPI00044172A5|nr:uncharacterized protein PUNSTDRAFT_68833 [Punctularia strigosozonata HHB-11173 SS5]EIN08650.1 hypothetical protein PUNSTDRAFT_68833 [Punctularia strigosozonata HHB-11173 SS5]